tara:strand:- start:2278 stop:3171 length:894 start_codon:yes stop_codon:yes gene_type:complete
MAKVLVTGGAGFIGANLVRGLVENGDDVTVFDKFSSGVRSKLDFFKGNIIEGDVSMNFDLDINFDVIYHEASITDTTFDDDLEMMRQNVDGFRNILRLALKYESKLVYASSAGVYGNGNVPMNEDQDKQPLNAYAKSKNEMDNMAMDHFDKIKIVGLRYFNVFGDGEEVKGKSASMILQLARQMMDGKNPRIFKMGEQVRDHIYVKDVVRATMLGSKSDKSGIYNVGTGVATSFNELIRHLNDVLGMDKEAEFFDNPYTEVYQHNTQASVEKSKSELGFKSEFSVAEGIKEYIGGLK